MALLTQPLRDEHKELFPHVEGLRIAADAIGDPPIERARQQVEAAYDFLANHLLVHAKAEERALYPAVGRAMGAAQATATMSRDHVEVERLTEQLGELRGTLSGATIDPVKAKALRRVLYGLYALVKVHFAKEEEVYLPILDQRLSADEAHRMFEAMEAAAEQARGVHAGG